MKINIFLIFIFGTLIFIKSTKAQSDIADIRFNNAGQVQSYIDRSGYYPSGRICMAETGRVYLRANDLQPRKRTLQNGTHITFLGTRENYAWVQVMDTTEHQIIDGVPTYRIIPTTEYGYVTAKYTCGYSY